MAEEQTNAGVATAATSDLLDTLLGAGPDSPLYALRRQRAAIAQFTQDSHDALLAPADLGGVSASERGLVALRAALLAPSAALADHYRAQLAAAGVAEGLIAAAERFPEGTGLSPRETLLLQFTDLLSRQPRAATPDNVAALTAGGLSTREVVTVAQLIAFVSYQARALAGLRALKEAL